jgi:hypothetical protein
MTYKNVFTDIDFDNILDARDSVYASVDNMSTQDKMQIILQIVPQLSDEAITNLLLDISPVDEWIEVE